MKCVGGVPESLLKSWLIKADNEAVNGVQSGDGGPFGASLDIYAPALDTPIHIGLAHNRVLTTGLPSAHAEDQVLSADNQAALVRELKRLKKQGVQGVRVVLSSSGQSCSNCQIKQEIVADRLIGKGLIEQGDFVVAYGASYEDTAQIAGFHDEGYSQDISSRCQSHAAQGAAHKHLISIPEDEDNPVYKVTELAKVRSDLANRFLDNRDNRRAFAVVIAVDAHNKIIAAYSPDEWDWDTQDNWLITPDILAIHGACKALQKSGIKDPYNLANMSGHPVLLTTTPDGTMSYATAQWAGITQISLITNDDSKPFIGFRESIRRTNRDLMRSIATPNASALTLVHVTPFPNKAQQLWRELHNSGQGGVLYNGVDVPQSRKEPGTAKVRHR